MHADAVLARLAERRRGIVTYGELRAAGLTRRQIQRRTESGHLIRLHQGVYAVGHQYLGPLARGEAAQLAAGPKSLLTHAYSLALHSVMPFPPTIDVTNPRGGARPPGLQVHQPRTLPPWTTKHGLRTTLLPQALLDFATVTTRDQLTQAVNQAYIGGKTNTKELRRIIERGHRGGVPLGYVIDGPRTRSNLERRLIALLEIARLPFFDDANVKING
ncbi:MAG: hypothetical protein QOF76_1303, partial [Solirubrobacteraceae bacterium]|nr:hypothetical protein [Solirubrobacteraceae bacterium]